MVGIETRSCPGGLRSEWRRCELARNARVAIGRLL